MSRIFHVLALLGGAIGFAVLVDHVGWSAMGNAITEAGWWFAWIALIDLASVVSDATGVYCFVRAEAEAPYWRVFAAQASGIAINRLTPANSLGEAIKVTMLVDHIAGDAPKSVAVSSIVKFNLATLYVALAVIVIGVPLTLLGLDLPRRLEILVWIGTAGVVVAGGLLALLLRRGAVTTFVRLLGRLRVISTARAARWTAKVQALDASIRAFGNPWSRRGVACVVGSRVLHFIATVAVMRAAHVPMAPSIVLGMLSVGIIVQWMASIVPLGLGLADGTNYVLYGVLGSSGIAGLAFTMVNRTRIVVLAAMGLAVMAIANLYDRTRPSSDRSSDSPSESRTEARATL